MTKRGNGNLYKTDFISGGISTEKFPFFPTIFIHHFSYPGEILLKSLKLYKYKKESFFCCGIKMKTARKKTLVDRNQKSKIHK
jgi:hypothetical protein